MTDEQAPSIAKAPSPLRFLLPSTVGIALFLTPIAWEDSQQIVVGILAGALQEGIGRAMPSLISILFMASALGSLLGSLAKPAWILGNETLRGVFVTSAPGSPCASSGACSVPASLSSGGPSGLSARTRGRSLHRARRHHFASCWWQAFSALLTDFGFLTSSVRCWNACFISFPPAGAGGARRRNLLGGGFLRGSPSDHPSVRGGTLHGREAAAVVTNFSAVLCPSA